MCVVKAHSVLQMCLDCEDMFHICFDMSGMYRGVYVLSFQLYFCSLFLFYVFLCCCLFFFVVSCKHVQVFDTFKNFDNIKFLISFLDHDSMKAVFKPC